MVRLSSPALGPSEWRTIPDLIRAQQDLDGFFVTVLRGGREETLTRFETYDFCARWARAFASAGIEQGDRVLLVMPNGLDFVGAFFGAQLAGGIPVPAPWPFFLSDVPKHAKSLLPLFSVVQPKVVATTERFAVLRELGHRLVTAPAAHPLARPWISKPETPAFIQFTSGSTSAPRGAVISHAAAIASARAMCRALSFSADDVGVSWLPLFHDMGLVGSLMCSLIARYPLHLLDPGEFLLHPDRWLARISEQRATITVAPNFAYELAARRIKSVSGLRLSSLRVALNGSEPVHTSTIARFEERFSSAGLRPGTVLPVYGLAEATLGVAFSAPGVVDPPLRWQGRSIPSVGRPIPGTEIEIRKGEQVLPEGEEGEITVRGPSNMHGYFAEPDRTSEVSKGGWLSTGDLGVIRGGALYVTGREKELVIKGGTKFHPYEIERVIAESFDVTPNGVAAFSTDNPDTGTEDLWVLVELRRAAGAPDERRIRGRVLEQLGVRADRVRLVSPGSLPRTTSGKVRRGAARLQIEGER